MSKIIKNNRKTCEDCNSSKPLGEFYNADKMFFPTGKMHICKDCALRRVDENGHEGLLGLLRLLNKPLYQDLYKGDIPDYVRMVNSMPQYRSVGFKDSDTLREINDVVSLKRIKPTELSEEDLKESEDFWGVGKQEWEYIYLNNEYSEYLNRYETEDSKAMEDLIEEICLTKLDIRNRRMSNQDVDKQLKTLQDLLGSSNLKPAQESGANSVEHETFGTLIKKWENERPLPDPDPEWKDVNGIRRLIIWFVGHMAEMAGKENPYKKEYEAEAEKYDIFREAMDDDK